MPIAMEESSNYKCSESHQNGGFFAATKGKENAMSDTVIHLRKVVKARFP